MTQPKFSACRRVGASDRMPTEIALRGDDSPGGSLTFTTLSGGVAQQSASSPLVEGAGVAFDSLVPAVSVAPPSHLPNPWLFDSESLIREIDRIRETALQVPTNGDANATHFGLQQVINAAWTLRENLRYVLGLHRQGQNAFRRAKQQHQTVYVQTNCLLIAC